MKFWNRVGLLVVLILGLPFPLAQTPNDIYRALVWLLILAGAVLLAGKQEA